jgi:hypothetical protein
MSETTPPAIRTHASLMARIVTDAAALWHRLWSTDQEIAADIKAHPELVAAADAIIASAPPEVRAGIDVAEQLAVAVQNVADQAAAVVPAKPAA